MKIVQADVFPIEIVFARMEEFERLSEEFTNYDGTDLIQPTADIKATVVNAKRKGEPYHYTLIMLSERATEPTLAHEAFHVAQEWMEYLGISVHYGDSNETFAYLIEWIVKEGITYLRDEHGTERDKAEA